MSDLASKMSLSATSDKAKHQGPSSCHVSAGAWVKTPSGAGIYFPNRHPRKHRFQMVKSAVATASKFMLLAFVCQIAFAATEAAKEAAKEIRNAKVDKSEIAALFGNKLGRIPKGNEPRIEELKRGKELAEVQRKSTLEALDTAAPALKEILEENIRKYEKHIEQCEFWIERLQKESYQRLKNDIPKELRPLVDRQTAYNDTTRICDDADRVATAVIRFDNYTPVRYERTILSKVKSKYTPKENKKGTKDGVLRLIKSEHLNDNDEGNARLKQMLGSEDVILDYFRLKSGRWQTRTIIKIRRFEKVFNQTISKLAGYGDNNDVCYKFYGEAYKLEKGGEWSVVDKDAFMSTGQEQVVRFWIPNTNTELYSEVGRHVDNWYCHLAGIKKQKVRK